MSYFRPVCKRGEETDHREDKDRVKGKGVSYQITEGRIYQGPNIISATARFGHGIVSWLQSRLRMAFELR